MLEHWFSKYDHNLRLDPVKKGQLDEQMEAKINCISKLIGVTPMAEMQPKVQKVTAKGKQM